MTRVTEAELAAYKRDGYLLVEQALTGDQLNRLREIVDDFVAGARGVSASDSVYDLETTHRPDDPRVRRIKLPHTHDPFFMELARSPSVTEPVRQLIGPNLRLHTSKINLKAAGYGAPIEWHQDWAFYPHTNDDILAAGIFLDDVGEDNGPLMVLPGSHTGPILDHHADGVFCGAIDATSAGLDLTAAKPVLGKAGSMSLHHVRLIHGSALNLSGRQRRVLFLEIRACDAWPLKGCGDLAAFDDLLLCGEPTLTPRLAAVPVRMPFPEPEGGAGSIYEYQYGANTRTFAELGSSDDQTSP